MPKRRELLLPTRFGLDEITHELYYVVEPYSAYETRQVRELEDQMRGEAKKGFLVWEKPSEIGLSTKLRTTTMFMNEADWEDILKLPKEKP